MFSSPVASATKTVNEGSGAENQTFTNTSSPTGYGTDLDVVPAIADSAVKTVRGAVMKVVSPDAAAQGTSSTPFIPIAIVLVLIGAVVLGFWSKR